MLAILFSIVATLALIPLILGSINLMLYRRLPDATEPGPALSVLVPARNEEARITPVIESILASRNVAFELVIADDSSTDATPDIIRAFAEKDDRVRLVTTPALPEGWMGKNNACHFLGSQARHEHLVFIDADVTVEPDALARLSSFMAKNPDWKLISGFPRQITAGFWEKLVIPLIHFVLLGFLPMPGMRYSNHPMFGTACGQLIAMHKSAYDAVGGHEAIRDRIHDGVHLPRRFRDHGFHTDLVDATDLAATRMYDNLTDLIAGLMKNAHEGMATPVGLPVWTFLLGGGQILPVVLLITSLLAGAPDELVRLAVAATVFSYGYRVMTTLRFKHSWLGALLHPFGIAFLLWIQFTAFIRRARGITVSWKDRKYG